MGRTVLYHFAWVFRSSGLKISRLQSGKGEQLRWAAEFGKIAKFRKDNSSRSYTDSGNGQQRRSKPKDTAIDLQLDFLHLYFGAGCRCQSWSPFPEADSRWLNRPYFWPASWVQQNPPWRIFLRRLVHVFTQMKRQALPNWLPIQTNHCGLSHLQPVWAVACEIQIHSACSDYRAGSYSCNITFWGKEK